MSTQPQGSTTEKHIEELEDQISALRTEVTQARLEQWQGRIDDLEVQAHLAIKEADERVGALIADVRSRIAKGREQMRDAGATATGIADALTEGIEKAIKDVREGLIKARETAGR
jgi:predicted  nucleic acid-binding Zn-ribbon protein